MKKRLSAKETLKQQIYMTKLCFKEAPLYMTFHIFESIKLQISIFFEFTWAINYCLEVAERGESWKKIMWCMIYLLIGIAISTVTFAIYEQYIMPKLKPTLYKAFRLRIYEKTRTMDLEEYDNTDFYKEFVMATAEADKCIDRYLETLNIYSGAFIQTVLTLAMTIYVNPIAIVFPLVALPLDMFMALRSNDKTIEARFDIAEYEQKREYQNRVFYLSDYAKELRLNKKMQDKCQKDFTDTNRSIEDICKKYGKKKFIIDFTKQTITYHALYHGLMITFLLYQALVLKSISLAHMLTSRSCAHRIGSQTRLWTLSWQEVIENSTYIKKIRELTNSRSNIISEKNLPIPAGKATIEVSHLNFAYVSGKPVLNDVNLTLKAGQKIALVGYNGSGKTTLVKMLLRLYDPNTGEINYNGVNIKDINVDDYRMSIGAVFQDFNVYAATLKENVILDVTEDSKIQDFQVEKALFEARFTLQDSRLIYQIETPITTEFEKDGVNLSGGEKQKVAIARTLYRRQNLIIMDEPSSALDPLSEYKLNQALNEIAKDKTVIFISHRLSTTRDADCIYMMEGGHIIEQGTHKELLKLDGKYAHMWNVQAGRYIADVH